MDLLGIVMRIVWTLSFFTGTISSGFVIYLTIFRTPKKYQNNAFFMRAHSTSEFIAGIFGWISMPRVIVTTDDIALSSFGICGLIGPKVCYYASCMFLQSLAVAATVVPINIIVRLYILTHRVPQASSLVLITVILVVPNIGLLALVITIYAPPESKIHLINEGKINNYTFYTYPVYGFQSIHVIQFRIFFFILVFCSLVSSNISLFVRMIILKKLKVNMNNILSNGTIMLQKRIVKMLTIQALLPIVGFLPSLQYYVLLTGITNSYVIQSTVLWIDSLFPFMSAAVYLMMVLEYKKIVFRRLRRELKRVPSGTSPPKGIVPISSRPNKIVLLSG